MTLPTGPAAVGFEPVVLPVSVIRQAGSACLVVAPACRYGVALYRPAAVWTGGVLEADEEDVLESESWCMCPLPSRERVLRVELRLLWLFLWPGAFESLAPDELARALQHPLAHVREAAFMVLGR